MQTILRAFNTLVTQISSLKKIPNVFTNQKEYAIYVEISIKWGQRGNVILNSTNAYHLIKICYVINVIPIFKIKRGAVLMEDA